VSETIVIPPEFWEHSAYADNTYVSKPFDEAMLASVQAELGYTLPAAYVALLRTQNGGTPRYTDHKAPFPPTWSRDRVGLSGIFGIGRDKDMSLCGECGSAFWSLEWGYPKIGVYFADCPSAGHDMLCLDYTACGPQGEPAVVHIEQEDNYRITVLAPNFQAFMLGLEPDPDFDPDFDL
jgi:hypothetical protein